MRFAVPRPDTKPSKAHHTGMAKKIGTDAALLVVIEHDAIDATRQHASEIILS